MRIGILTLPLNTNYGGILQAYALQTVLERMGHSVSILDAPNGKPFKLPLYKMPLAYAKRFVLRYILHSSDTPILFEQWLWKKQKELERHTRRFIVEYLHDVQKNNYYDLQEKDFDAIVVGSDQVWRPCYFPHRDGMSIQDAYLAFAENWNILRIAYAASFGTDEWEYSAKETKRCGQLTKLFNGISVRERSGVNLLKDHFGADAIHVLDPTMLLHPGDYSRLIECAESDGALEKEKTEKDYILSYVLDEKKDINRMLNDIAQREGVEVRRSRSKPFSVSSFSNNDLEEYVQPPVESWLKDFRDCKYVVTDSFHACVFSILNHKQFIVIGNKERGLSRFESLLQMFGLEDRMILKDTDFCKTLLQPIDYESVDEKLDELRKNSYEFLKNNLSKGKE